MKVDKMQLWMLISDTLSNLPAGEQWTTDTLWLAANWNNCYMDGKHELTTDKEWEILDPIMKNGTYTEENCKALFDILDEERFEIYMKLSYGSETMSPIDSFVESILTTKWRKYPSLNGCFYDFAGNEFPDGITLDDVISCFHTKFPDCTIEWCDRYILECKRDSCITKSGILVKLAA